MGKQIAVFAGCVAFCVAFSVGFTFVKNAPRRAAEAERAKDADSATDSKDDSTDDNGVEYFDGKGNRLHPKMPKGGSSGPRIKTISTGDDVDVRNQLASSGKTIVEFTAAW